MVLGQSSATAAALAIDEKIALQNVNYKKLEKRLLQDKQVLAWRRRSGDSQRVIREVYRGVLYCRHIPCQAEEPASRFWRLKVLLRPMQLIASSRIQYAISAHATT